MEDLAAEVLTDIYGASGEMGADGALERAAQDGAAQALLAKQGAALAPGERGARCAAAVAGLVSALAERDAEYVAGAGADSLGG